MRPLIHRHPLPRSARLGLLAGLLAGAIGARAADAAALAAGRKLVEGGRYAEARAALAPIAAAEPQNAEAQFCLGWAELRLHQPEEAVKLLERATDLDGTQSLYFQVLGDACGEMTGRVAFFSKLGWARKCLAAYDRAVALDPDNLDARSARMAYFRHVPTIAGGGMDKAHAEAEEIRRRDPVRGAQAHADLYVAEQKVAEAFAVIDGLLAQRPGHAPAQYQLGRLAAITGRQLDRGAAALQAYLQYSPKDGEPAIAAAHWRLGMIREQAGDRPAARAEYEAALRLAPDFAVVRDALAKLR
jgi:tetratricopeptide (TPR) repeat protein